MYSQKLKIFFLPIAVSIIFSSGCLATLDSSTKEKILKEEIASLSDHVDDIRKVPSSNPVPASGQPGQNPGAPTNSEINPLKPTGKPPVNKNNPSITEENLVRDNPGEYKVPPSTGSIDEILEAKRTDSSIPSPAKKPATGSALKENSKNTSLDIDGILDDPLKKTSSSSLGKSPGASSNPPYETKEPNGFGALANKKERLFKELGSSRKELEALKRKKKDEFDKLINEYRLQIEKESSKRDEKDKELRILDSSIRNLQREKSLKESELKEVDDTIGYYKRQAKKTNEELNKLVEKLDELIARMNSGGLK